MDASLTTISTFAAGTLSAFGLCSLGFDYLMRDRMRVNKRLSNEFREGLQSRVRRSSLFKDLNDRKAGSQESDPDLLTRLHTMIEQSGLDIRMEKLLATSCALSISAVLAVLLFHLHWALAIPSAIFGFAIPFGYIAWKRTQRLQKLCEQLPEAFELMSRAVRSGQTMSAAMQLVASHCKAPISHEFAYCCEQESLGLPQEVTLRDLARRNTIMELQLFSVALLVQRRSGGNPVEVLNNLSHVIRKRIRMKARARALTSEGRMQAIVLSVLPLVAFAAIYILNRDYVQTLLDHPWILGSTFAFQMLGVLWIRKIVNIEF